MYCKACRRIRVQVKALVEISKDVFLCNVCTGTINATFCQQKDLESFKYHKGKTNLLPAVAVEQGQ